MRRPAAWRKLALVWARRRYTHLRGYAADKTAELPLQLLGTAVQEAMLP
jgi:hypothetical protein